MSDLLFSHVYIWLGLLVLRTKCTGSLLTGAFKKSLSCTSSTAVSAGIRLTACDGLVATQSIFVTGRSVTRKCESAFTGAELKYMRVLLVPRLERGND